MRIRALHWTCMSRRHTWLRRTSASARTVSSSKFLSTAFCSRSTRASSSSSADCCESSLFSLVLLSVTSFFSDDSGAFPFTVVSSSEVVDASVVTGPVELVAEQLICIELRSDSKFCTTFSDCVALAVQSRELGQKIPIDKLLSIWRAHQVGGRPAPGSSLQCRMLARRSKRQKCLRRRPRRERQRVLMVQ